MWVRHAARGWQESVFSARCCCEELMGGEAAGKQGLRGRRTTWPASGHWCGGRGHRPPIRANSEHPQVPEAWQRTPVPGGGQDVTPFPRQSCQEPGAPPRHSQKPAQVLAALLQKGPWTYVLVFQTDAKAFSSQRRERLLKVTANQQKNEHGRNAIGNNSSSCCPSLWPSPVLRALY